MKEKQKKTRWKKTYTVAVIVLVVISAFPVFNFVEQARMKQRMVSQVEAFFDAISENDLSSAEQSILVVSNTDIDNNRLKEVWAEKYKGVQEQGYIIKSVGEIDYQNDDFCPKVEVSITITNGQKEATYNQRVFTSPKCAGSSFKELYIPYIPSGNQIIDEISFALSSVIERN